MLKLALFVDGLDLADEALESLDRAAIATMAYQAINHTADRARSLSADEIRRQVNFPASYLKPSDGRLAVTKKANANSLEAVITGRHRATSLARFVTSGAVGKAGVNVIVKPGKNEEMKRAFLMRIRSGKAELDTAHNLGLAIRVEKGTVPSRAYKPVRIADGLFLLYGPSVSQVFNTVRADVTPDVEKELQREFDRLVALRTR